MYVHLQYFYDYTPSFKICLDPTLEKEIKYIIICPNRSLCFVSINTLAKKKKKRVVLLKQLAKLWRVGYFPLIQLHNLAYHSFIDVSKITGNSWVTASACQAV